MERYAIETEVSKEAVYNGQMPLNNLIGMMIQQNDAMPHKLHIEIDDMAIKSDMSEPRETFRVKMRFYKVQEVIIKAGE